MEEQAGPADQYLGSFRHGDSSGKSVGSLCVVDGSQLTKDDADLLEALGYVVQASGLFSFGIVTNTLSVTEQLDFGYRLIRLAGWIRTRVEKTEARRGTKELTT